MSSYTYPIQRRRWILRLSIIILALTLLVLVDNLLPTTPPPVQPTATPRNDIASFYFPALPTWSSVTLDGKTLQSIPQQNSRNPLTVPNGEHTLTWNAQPFQPWSCTLTVPIASTQQADRCPVKVLTYADRTYLLLVPVSLQQLPDDQRTALIETTQATLDTKQVTEEVRPGEQYTFAHEPANTYTANEQLTATHRLQLHTKTPPPASCQGLSLGQGCRISEQDCQSFCTLESWPLTDSNIPQWNIAALFHEIWSYQTASGQTLSPRTSPDESAHYDQFVTLQVRWIEQRWSVVFQTAESSTFDDPLCIAPASIVLTQPQYQRAPGLDEVISWNFVSNAPQTASCLLAGFLRADINAKPQQASIALLSRFGILYTTNEKAHNLWPNLPQTDTEATRLADAMLKRAHL